MFKTKSSSLVLTITAVLFATLAVILLLLKQTPISLISYIVCAGVALLGALHLVQFVRKNNKSAKKQEQYFNDDESNLAFAVVFFVVAVYFVIFPKTLWQVLPLVVGFCVLFNAVRKIQISFKAKDIYEKAWLFFAIVSFLNVATSLLLIINPFTGGGNIIFWACAMLWDSATSVLLLIVSALSGEKAREKKAKREAKKQNRQNKNAQGGGIPFPSNMPVIQAQATEVQDTAEDAAGQPAE